MHAFLTRPREKLFPTATVTSQDLSLLCVEISWNYRVHFLFFFFKLYIYILYHVCQKILKKQRDMIDAIDFFISMELIIRIVVFNIIAGSHLGGTFMRMN